MTSSKADFLYRTPHVSLVILLMLSLVGLAESAHAQIDGAYPQSSLIQSTDGNFYGAVAQSATNGCGAVFKITPAGKLTTLHAFTGGSDGSWPNGLIRSKDGNFYGTTFQSGANGYGTVFQITPVGKLTTLYTFTGGSDGGSPSAALFQNTDGYFYGVTGSIYNEAGTPISYGTVFKITAAGQLTTLYRFTGGNDGASPTTSLILGKDGNLYSSTALGGAKDYGTVFKITPTGQVKTFYTFTGGNDGGLPAAPLVLGTDGNFYGTTPLIFDFTTLQITSYGTVFKITPTGQLTTFYTFTGGRNGGSPNGLVLGTNGNFYGVTGQDYVNGSYGTAFQITPAGKLTTLYTFTGGSDGAFPAAALVLASDGNYYGTANSGGAYGVGSVFKLTPSGVLTALHSFSGYEVGPTSLMQAADGNLYGATFGHTIGGANTSDNGSIFKVNLKGQQTPLYTFTGGSDGGSPTGLSQATDGNFYGTTYQGGTSDAGTVFSVSTKGVLTTLYSFTGSRDGSAPQAALIQGADGNLYGTTSIGGTFDQGVVFTVTTKGVLTTLYSFTGGSDGGAPQAALVQGADGNLYGTTSVGGAFGHGTVFTVTTKGVLTTLYAFIGGSDGGTPQAALVQFKTGTLYGTTSIGGTFDQGVVFSITTKGVLTTLYSFTGGSDGGTPQGALTFGNNGFFYGATYSGGANGWGTLFRITPGGALTTLYSFTDAADGALPQAALCLASDGNFYSGATKGGANQAGTIYRLTGGGAFTALYSF